jgi:hypothetical protein
MAPLKAHRSHDQSITPDCSPLLSHWNQTYFNHSVTMYAPMSTPPNHPPRYPVPLKAPAMHWQLMFLTTYINLYIASLLPQSAVSQNLVLIQKLLPIPNGRQLCSLNYRHFNIMALGSSLHYQRAKL